MGLSLKVMENKANDLALQKKLELKDELTKELATKADLKLVEVGLRAEIQQVETRLEGKIDLVRSEIKVYHAQTRLYFVVLICVIIISNPTSIELIAKLLGIVK
jgi:hypothetical protein